jgi:hypothetical protein
MMMKWRWQGWILRCGVAKHAILAVISFIAASALAQQPPQTPPVADMSAFDSEKVGYHAISIDLKAAGIAFEPLDQDIDRWQNFLDQARQEVAALGNSTNPSDQAEVARLKMMIPPAESHLAVLRATKKLRQDAEYCGMEAARADWLEVEKFIEQERQRLAPALEMAKKVQAQASGTYRMINGGAGASMIAEGAALMQEQMDSDDEIETIIKDHSAFIAVACADAKRAKDFETYLKNLEAANVKAKQAAEEAEKLAENGRFSDIPEIRKRAAIVLAVARANQLLGHDKLGLEQQQAITHAAQTLITKAAATCRAQSAPIIVVLGLEKQAELLGMSGNILDSCSYRLFESSGVAGELPYRIRHCGSSLSGTWYMQVTRGTINGERGKLEGKAEVPDFGEPMKVSTPVVNFSGTIYQTAPATIEASGKLSDAQTREDMRVKGTIQILFESYTLKPGIDKQEMKMHSEMKLDGFNATPVGGGSTTHYPGMASPAFDQPIAIINENKPCDPSADVWQYPPL